uniref:Uncharacterized protein n=1 Tax=Vespula pensylvanica TaxID=30213 RepID=A0A834U4U8_VESPE|nr:hypothetical protein H0235_011113 [Vespula pensylvanica]
MGVVKWILRGSKRDTKRASERASEEARARGWIVGTRGTLDSRPGALAPPKIMEIATGIKGRGELGSVASGRNEGIGQENREENREEKRRDG